MAALKQSAALLTQDKKYLTGQVTDVNNRHTLAAERLQQVSVQLEAAKTAHQEIYEKFISARYITLLYIL